uniref:F-box/LRR-repeat protein 15/At3g58940/PEG3-like LRR domain-containing protein n=1 Tax=Aegilops tauschii subsp. strangulata TaxID=200361 RepID=A0A453JUE4_AEGTS
ADLLDAPSTTVDSLLRSDALGNLQELEFSCFEQPPPVSIFRFSPTLRVVTIGCSNLPDSTVQGIHFPLLKQLGLEFVCISECSLHSLIASCPALESLLIHRSFGFPCIQINSLSLKSVGLDSYAVWENNPVALQLQELIISNAPCLERLLLLHQETGLHISVIVAPKLETIGFLSDGYYECSQDHLYRLAFGSTVILGLHVDNLEMVVRTVKILAIQMKALCLDTVIDLLTCFPCLEKLYIKVMILHRKLNYSFDLFLFSSG